MRVAMTSKTTEISFTNNVFSAFAYGIEKGPFAFTLSLRHEDEHFLAFDDLLGLSACHFNIIPTSVYMADWRFLLRDPTRGRALVDALHARCVAVLRSQFLARPEWRRAVFRDADALSDDDIVRSVVCGFNYPPSQYQLHLQFIVLPLLPFQYEQYVRGVHCTHGRFFPLQYVRAVLALDSPLHVDDDTSVESIVAHYKARGVDYDVVHARMYEQLGEQHRRLANWQSTRFSALIVSNGPGTPAVVLDRSTLEPRANANAAAVRDNDKLTLQNYGRPYTADNKPTGTYYSIAKQNVTDMISY